MFRRERIGIDFENRLFFLVCSIHRQVIQVALMSLSVFAQTVTPRHRRPALR